PLAVIFVGIKAGNNTHTFVAQGQLNGLVIDITLTQLVSILRQDNPWSALGVHCLPLLSTLAESQDPQYVLARSPVPLEVSDDVWPSMEAGLVEVGSLHQCLLLDPSSKTVPPARQSPERRALIQNQGLEADTRLYVIYVYPRAPQPFTQVSSNTTPITNPPPPLLQAPPLFTQMSSNAMPITNPPHANATGDVSQTLCNHLWAQYPAEMQGLDELWTGGYGSGYVGHRTVHFIRCMAQKLGFLWKVSGQVTPKMVHIRDLGMDITLDNIAQAIKLVCPSYAPGTLKNKRTEWKDLVHAIDIGEAYTDLSDDQLKVLNELRSISDGHPTPLMRKKYADPLKQYVKDFVKSVGGGLK
ncbi:hypothetical protein BDN72DRAFT_866438, partial [Pluteus cervinus]